MHGEPQTAKTVLYQELNNPAGSKDLSCGRQIRLLELFLPLEDPVERSGLLLGVEVLIDPANGLFVARSPILFALVGVECVDQFL